MLFGFAGFLLNIVAWLIVARSLLSWFPSSQGHVGVQLLHQITDPILVPIQRVIPRFGTMDISPMIAVLLLFWISRFLMSLS